MQSKITCFLRKILRIDKFDKFDQETSGFKYLTAEHMAELEGISIGDAKRKLDAAVSDGFLEKRFLFTEIDLDLTILVEEEQIGKTILIDDLPKSVESKEIYISPHFTKEIYVAS